MPDPPIEVSGQPDRVDLAMEAKKRIIPIELQVTTIPENLQYQLAGVQLLQIWRNPRGGLPLVLAALKQAGVERGAARVVDGTLGRRDSGGANIDLADLGNFGFLSKIAFWRRHDA